PEEGGLSPLALGDDEDVDLGSLPPPKADQPSSRADLSGVNLHDPADSGISLEKKKKTKPPASDDGLDFELTVDEDATGPRTLKGKITDSDSEFELTIEDTGPVTSRSGKLGSAPMSGDDQKDIFETDFDLPAMEEQSASQAVAL